MASPTRDSPPDRLTGKGFGFLSRLGHLAVLAAPVGLTLLFFWKILLTNLILVGVDTFLYFYPYKAYAAAALRQGRLPLWNPHLFMGAPLLANSQVGLFYPPNWFFLWLDAPGQVAWSIGLHITLAGGLMLALARLGLRLGWPGSLAAAILFAFGGYLGAQVEHVNQLNAAAWLPLLFLLADFSQCRPRRLLWVLLLGLVIALTLLAGHAQTVFISLAGLGLYGLARAGLKQLPSQRGGLREGETQQTLDLTLGDNLNLTPLPRPPAQIAPPLKGRFTFYVLRFTFYAFHSLWPLAAACGLAVLLAAVQLLPTAELSGLSIRSGGLSFREVVSFSLRPTALHYSLLPPLGLDMSQVLGEAFSEWVAYLGISGLVLALLGLLVALWRPAARPFALVAGSGLVLSLGLFTGPLYLALYYLVPGFNLFRVPARWLLLYAFGMAVLAGFGVDALGEPRPLRHHLAAAWSWLAARPWRAAVLVGLPSLFLLALILYKTPPLLTLLAWLGLALAGGMLIGWALHRRPGEADRIGGIPLVFLLLLLTAELFWAAQSLNYNRPTAPQAYHSLRNAVAFLLAAAPEAGPPDRFLSLSGITYDPGDLAELRQVYGDQLSPEALYELVVATKAKEVLFYNLPMLYGLHSVDGYDGGILPLARFVTLQRLFLPAGELSLDGRLREKLRFVPAGRLLSLLNTRWIITDKVFDVWIDGIFYDLQFPARLATGEEVTTREIPPFPATAIGLVSHLEDGAGLPEGTPVAELALEFANGQRERFVLRAGPDTAEGSYPAGAAHTQARIGVAWPYEAAGVDYVTVYTLTERPPLQAISVTAILPAGRFVLRGLSLIHGPTGTSRSLLLSTEGDYRQVHSGDVKIYENRAVLPRAFVVHRTEVVSDDEVALRLLQSSAFDPAAALVRLPEGNESPGPLMAGWPSPGDRVTITRYEPERVEVSLDLDSPGWLVLTDAAYPGWQAALDGRPVEIFTADILFRGVAVPAGEHSLVFQFQPRSVQIGVLASGLGLILLVGGLGLSFWETFRKYERRVNPGKEL